MKKKVGIYGKAEIEKMFHSVFKMTFESESGTKKWKTILSLWYLVASNGHFRSQRYLGTCYGLGQRESEEKFTTCFLIGI